MEIGVGEYVRTKNKGIKKIDHLAVNPNVTVNKYRYYLGIDDDGDRCYGVLKTTDILKHSKNIIDLIEDEDIAILEYKSPKYRERIIRRFEVSKIDDDIMFENSHCDFHCKVGDKKITDMICKNIKIKSVVTKEQFSNIEYIVEE